jgi:prepilin-type processing-associated H-X9-DG protein
MRQTDSTGKAKVFTLLELLILVAGIAILAALLLPVRGGPRKARRIICMSNLRQVGLAINVFAVDHNDEFPMRISVTNGGSMEFVGTGSPAPHFHTVSNYLSGDWRPLRCPTDESKERTTNHASLNDRNISYFLSMDASYRTTNIILAGDRNLEVAGQPVKPGLFALTPIDAVRWTSELHSQGRTALGGNVLFVDGHVESPGRKLPAVIQRQNLATNHLAFP